jgi:hypothetical protein
MKTNKSIARKPHPNHRLATITAEQYIQFFLRDWCRPEWCIGIEEHSRNELIFELATGTKVTVRIMSKKMHDEALAVRHKGGIAIYHDVNRTPKVTGNRLTKRLANFAHANGWKREHRPWKKRSRKRTSWWNGRRRKQFA